MFGDFGEEIEGAGGGEIAEQGELRLEKFAGVDVDQFAILALEIGHLNVRKPFQTGSKSAFRAPRAAGDASQLAEITRQKTDDEIAFFEGTGLQDEGFAHTSGHINCDARNFKGITRGMGEE